MQLDDFLITVGKTRKTSSSSDGTSNGSKARLSKGVKLSTLKKITLPPHPLLAAEFKGHTGFICDLDFDVNGKYLASCSDGKFCFVSFDRQICFHWVTVR